jgi:hypothetical protein
VTAVGDAHGDRARERVLLVAAAAGVLGESWPVQGGLDGVDWGWLLPRARALALPARLWAELVRAGLGGALPAEVRAELEQDAQVIAVRGAVVAEAAARAGALLDRAGVAWLPTKGAALALVLPAYAAVRAAADVDLLVRAGDLERAQGALARVYPLVNHPHDYDGAERTAAEAAHAGVLHLYSFRGAGGVTVELHHAIAGLTTAEELDGLLARAEPIAARGGSVRVPALDDLLGIACVHALEQHAGDRRRLLRHLGDVTELVARGASAEAARARYDAPGHETVAESLRLLAEARDDARVGGGAPSAARLAVEPGAAGRARGWAGRVGTRLGLFGEALRTHGVRAVVPPRSFMVGIYGPSAAGPRLPLLHLHRWAAIALRTIKGK